MVHRDPEERLFLEEQREYFNTLSLDELRGLKADYQKLKDTMDPIHFRLLMEEIDKAYWRGDSR